MNGKTKKLTIIAVAVILLLIAIIVIAVNNKSNVVIGELPDKNVKNEETTEIKTDDRDLDDNVEEWEGSNKDNTDKGNSKDKKSTKSNSASGNSSNNSSDSSSNGMTYEKYISMSPEKQQKYFESFSNTDDFLKWYNMAKAKYDKEHKADVEGGNIDIGDYID